MEFFTALGIITLVLIISSILIYLGHKLYQVHCFFKQWGDSDRLSQINIDKMAEKMNLYYNENFVELQKRICALENTIFELQNKKGKK